MLVEERGDAKLHLLSPQMHMSLPQGKEAGRPREAGAPSRASATGRVPTACRQGGAAKEAAKPRIDDGRGARVGATRPVRQRRTRVVPSHWRRTEPSRRRFLPHRPRPQSSTNSGPPRPPRLPAPPNSASRGRRPGDLPLPRAHSWRWRSDRAALAASRSRIPGVVLGGGGVWRAKGVEEGVQEVGTVVI
jgi:hypothetical protein